MNYGYAVPGANTLRLAETDEPDRHWIQLYHHVAGAVDLEKCTVLEVGSGRGGGASFIKCYLRPASVIGVDVSKDAIDLSRKRHRVDGLEFRVGDAEDLPFDDSSLDVVVNVESSHCYPSFQKFMAEVRRVLQPGGHLLYADFRDWSSVEAWRESLKGSGLSIVREEDITSNVILALERDNDRKLALINQIVPRALRPSFLDFAAVRGSALFEGFQSGRFTYRSFVLRNSIR